MISKVLITVPTLEGGGMERAALNYAISFSRLGYEVKIFTVSNNVIYFDIPSNIEVISGKRRTENILLAPLSLYRFRKFCEKFQPKFVLSFSGKMSPYICISLIGTKISVIPFHRSNPTITYGKFNNMLSEILYSNCKALVVQTTIAKSIFIEKYKNKNIIVLRNPIRELFLEQIPKEKIIITVSRLVKGKGVDTLIKIFSTLNYNDWVLHILGDGEMRDSLEELVESLHLQDKVKFLGFQKNVDYFLSKASVFAFTSESEGYPNALLEAMCAGLACISFDCPTGPSEMIIDGQNGFLIKMYDNENYADKLTVLIENSSIREQFSREALKLRESHDADKLISSFINQIESLEK